MSKLTKDELALLKDDELAVLSLAEKHGALKCYLHDFEEIGRRLAAARRDLAELREAMQAAANALPAGLVFEADGDVARAISALRRELPSGLTIRFCQQHQPWTVPYAIGVAVVADKHINQGGVPHILGSHCALHAAKSVGKLAAVFETLDHPDPTREKLWTGEPSQVGAAQPNAEQLATIKAMSADLVTAALRFANLYGFDLETVLDERVREKNGTGYTDALLPAEPRKAKAAPFAPSGRGRSR